MPNFYCCDAAAWGQEYQGAPEHDSGCTCEILVQKKERPKMRIGPNNYMERLDAEIGEARTKRYRELIQSISTWNLRDILEFLLYQGGMDYFTDEPSHDHSEFSDEAVCEAIRNRITEFDGNTIAHWNANCRPFKE